jgi:SOS-response transcriptional repressor LexA
MGKNTELTSDEKALLRAYRRHADKHGAPPSVRELATTLDVAPSVAHYRLGRVIAKGFIIARPITLIRPTLSAKGRRAV